MHATTKNLKPSLLVVAAAQMKFRASIAENVSWIVETIHASAREGTQVILFPECSVTGYNRDFNRLPMAEVEAGLEAIGLAARTAHCHALVGTPIQAGRKRFNSLLVFDRRGRRVACYSKIHLTERDTRFFTRGNALAYFELSGVPCTTIICHERRYPELVRLPVMMGAQIVFHPNAGLDSLAVSKTKRHGRDGIAVRAFENQVYYIFANSVGPQGDGMWSAGDSKIVAPDMQVLACANNRDEEVIHAKLDLSKARRRYACDALKGPAFLKPYWQAMLSACKRQLRL